jgi:hypothetical protein
MLSCWMFLLHRVGQNMRAVLPVTYLAVIFSFNAKGSFVSDFPEKSI